MLSFQPNVYNKLNLISLSVDVINYVMTSLQKHSGFGIWLILLIFSLTQCVKESPATKEKDNYTGYSGFVSDIDGNKYQVFGLGTQIWMSQNLRTTRLNNGLKINLVTDNNQWKSHNKPGYCWYNNDYITYGSVYGALYNWFAVETGNLCPTGWHVPTDAEWTILTDFLGGLSVAGGPLKEAGTTHWNSPNTGATNSSGFTALPGGGRGSNNGSFYNIGYGGLWWSSSAGSSIRAFGRELLCDYSFVSRPYYEKEFGFSVRCVRD